MRSWEELAAIARQRRTQLGRTQQGVAERAIEQLGPKALSEPTVRVFEKAGRDSYRGQTLTAISLGLDWPRDALQRLQTSAVDPEDLDTPDVAPPWEALLEGQRQLTAQVERLADLLEDRG